MNIDTLYARAETVKKLKTKIDKMKLGCECDFKTVGEDEITLVLKFGNKDSELERKVVTGFACS